MIMKQISYFPKFSQIPLSPHNIPEVIRIVHYPFVLMKTWRLNVETESSLKNQAVCLQLRCFSLVLYGSLLMNSVSLGMFSAFLFQSF